MESQLYRLQRQCGLLPPKAIQYQRHEAYAKLNNIITRRTGLPDRRTRYRNPHISAKDLLSDGEKQ